MRSACGLMKEKLVDCFFFNICIGNLQMSAYQYRRGLRGRNSILLAVCQSRTQEIRKQKQIPEGSRSKSMQVVLVAVFR